MSDNFCLNVAQRSIRDYTDEADAAVQASHKTEDCWKCQDFLQMGINSYQWLKRADEFMREADSQGLEQYTPELQDMVETMYRAWLHPCGFAEEWIKENRGFQIDNLKEFRDICEEVQDIIQNREWRRSAKRARIFAADSLDSRE